MIALLTKDTTHTLSQKEVIKIDLKNNQKNESGMFLQDI